MIAVTPLSTTHREIAERLIGAVDLLGIARGELQVARSSITSSQHAASGGGENFRVVGRHVDYDWHGTVGRVSVLDLVKLAASIAHPDVIARLRAAGAARNAALVAENAAFGPSWARTRDVRVTPRYAAHQAALTVADREFSEAAAAWWRPEERPILDVPAPRPIARGRGRQLDLFAMDGQLDLLDESA